MRRRIHPAHLERHTAPLPWALGLALALALTVLPAAARTPAGAPGRARQHPWTEGIQYVRIDPAQPTGLPADRVELTEVFSYGCPYCARFQPAMQALVAGLPPDVQVDYLPAGFAAAEDFPMFERAYFTAQMLGVAARTHAAMFDAVWRTGELSIYDPRTNRLKSPLPGIADAARFYQRHAGVPVARFLAVAHSAAVNTRIEHADALVRAYRIAGTPSIIVNGEYRVNLQALHGNGQLIGLVRWLVTQAKRRGSKGSLPVQR
jgi:protein dithiol oxidoreductase (disulfide-forming)